MARQTCAKRAREEVEPDAMQEDDKPDAMALAEVFRGPAADTTRSIEQLLAAGAPMPDENVFAEVIFHNRTAVMKSFYNVARQDRYAPYRDALTDRLKKVLLDQLGFGALTVEMVDVIGVYERQLFWDNADRFVWEARLEVVRYMMQSCESAPWDGAVSQAVVTSLCEAGCTGKVRILLAADESQVQRPAASAMSAAIKRGNIALVRVLLAGGMPPPGADILAGVLDTEHLAMAQLLLEHGTPLPANAAELLRSAMLSDNIAVAQFLLDRGVPLQLSPEMADRMYIDGSVEMVQLALDALDALDAAAPPLFADLQNVWDYVCSFNKVRMAQLLLERKVPFKEPDELQSIFLEGSVEMITLLLGAGASLPTQEVVDMMWEELEQAPVDPAMIQRLILCLKRGAPQGSAEAVTDRVIAALHTAMAGPDVDAAVAALQLMWFVRSKVPNFPVTMSVQAWAALHHEARELSDILVAISKDARLLETAAANAMEHLLNALHEMLVTEWRGPRAEAHAKLYLQAYAKLYNLNLPGLFSQDVEEDVLLDVALICRKWAQAKELILSHGAAEGAVTAAVRTLLKILSGTAEPEEDALAFLGFLVPRFRACETIVDVVWVCASEPVLRGLAKHGLPLPTRSVYEGMVQVALSEGEAFAQKGIAQAKHRLYTEVAAARVIQWRWRWAVASPRRLLCQRRLLREISE